MNYIPVIAKKINAQGPACKCRGSGTSQVFTLLHVVSRGQDTWRKAPSISRSLWHFSVQELILKDIASPGRFCTLFFSMLYFQRMGGFQKKDTLKNPAASSEALVQSQSWIHSEPPPPQVRELPGAAAEEWPPQRSTHQSPAHVNMLLHRSKEHCRCDGRS